MGCDFSRRDFLAGLSAAGFSLALNVESSRGFQANDTLSVGLVGVGGRCRFLAAALKKIPNVRVAAACDVGDRRLADAKALADSDAFFTKDYRELLDRGDLDAVLIATPDHWHSPLTIAACDAGKDVYVEKPLTHDLKEGAAVLAAQQRTRAVVQVGMQQRSMPQMQQAREIIRAGELGEIHKVHMTWNRNTNRTPRNLADVDPKSIDWKMFLGNAPTQPFDAYRYLSWRWFWDFGGGLLTDLMTHHMDIANWVLDLGEPASAASMGDHVSDDDRWETPDTVQTLIHYPERKVQVYFEGTFANARNAAMIEFMGANGTLYVDRGRYEILPERNSKLKPTEHILGQGPRGQDFYLEPDGELLHLTNWVECIRSRETPIAPVEAGIAAVWAPHLGNHSLRSGKMAQWKEYS